MSGKVQLEVGGLVNLLLTDPQRKVLSVREHHQREQGDGCPRRKRDCHGNKHGGERGGAAKERWGGVGSDTGRG